MTLNRHYRIAAVYPSLAIIVLTIVFSIIDNYNYKSEWLTADGVIFVSITTALIYCLVLCMLSLTIFLNKFDKVKESNLLTLLSWFLSPLAFIATIFVHEINFRIKYETKFSSDFIYIMILNLPFVFSLTWSYLKYRKTK